MTGEADEVIENLRNTRFKVHVLVLMAVKTGTGMDEDGWNLLGFVTEPQQPSKGSICAVRSVGHVSIGGMIMATVVHYYARIMGTRAYP